MKLNSDIHLHQSTCVGSYAGAYLLTHVTRNVLRGYVTCYAVTRRLTRYYVQVERNSGQEFQRGWKLGGGMARALLSPVTRQRGDNRLAGTVNRYGERKAVRARSILAATLPADHVGLAGVNLRRDVKRPGTATRTTLATVSNDPPKAGYGASSLDVVYAGFDGSRIPATGRWHRIPVFMMNSRAYYGPRIQP